MLLTPDDLSKPQLIAGYTPGAIARIVELHALYYAQGLGFGLSFEARLAIELSSFLLSLDPNCDALITAAVSGVIVGSITVDGRTLGPTEAQLRWFVFDSEYKEVGSALMREALQFCRSKNFQRVLISTMAATPLTETLTEEWGFTLFQTNTGHQWDRPVEERILQLAL
jgi:GNAT superfamily N-acetyltransferase